MPAHLWSDLCRNPHCGDLVRVRRWRHLGLCPSCWWQMKAGFAFGAFATGLILGAVSAFLR